MRHFRISENAHSPATWSVDEIVAGHSWRVADVNSWRIEPPRSVGVSACACGFIKIVAERIIVVHGQARFS